LVPGTDLSVINIWLSKIACFAIKLQ